MFGGNESRVALVETVVRGCNGAVGRGLDKLPSGGDHAAGRVESVGVGQRRRNNSPRVGGSSQPP